MLKRLSSEDSSRHSRLLSNAAATLGNGSTSEDFEELQALLEYVAYID
jgi:hypothetical protein